MRIFIVALLTAMGIGQIYAFKDLSECINDALRIEYESYVEENEAGNDIISDTMLVYSDNIPNNFKADSNIVFGNIFFFELFPKEIISWAYNGCECIRIRTELSRDTLTIYPWYYYTRYGTGYVENDNDTIFFNFPRSTVEYQYIYNCQTKSWERAEDYD